MIGLWSEHFAAASDNPTTSTVDVSPTKTNGDWSQHLPASDQPTTPSPSPRDQYQRCLLCPKCNTAIFRRTSTTDKNPGRHFYTCSAHNYKFFKWADEVNPNQLIDVPNCGGCGAGACRVRRETIGPNAGRILFTCRIKEGEGACGYSVWQDELEKFETALRNERIRSSQSTISCDDISATNIDLVVESNKVDEEEDIVTPIINTSEHHKCRAIISPKMGQENKPNEFSRRPHKRSRHGDLKASGSLVSTRSLKVLLSVNNVPTEYSWMDDAKRQNLTSQLHGWWGRLAFQPKPCLVTYASKSNTCYVSFPLDSTFVVQDPTLVNNIGSTTLTRSRIGVKLKKCRSTLEEKILVNSRDLTTVARNLREAESYGLCRCENTELFLAALDEPSLSKTKMSKSISNAFCEAAQHLQNDLLTLLEKMEVNDHVAMRDAAEATFAALDRLLFGHQDFKNRVNELIHCASSLSEIEQSMPTNDSYQKLVERCSSERKRLDEINCVHAETINTVSSKKKCLKDLQEEISSTLDLLFQIEAEISCFEIEMRVMENQLEQISRDKEELEGKYLIAFKEVEKSEKLFERKEEERGAAKAAYDRARALLRE